MVTLWSPEDEPKEDVTDEEETGLEAVSGTLWRDQLPAVVSALKALTPGTWLLLAGKYSVCSAFLKYLNITLNIFINRIVWTTLFLHLSEYILVMWQPLITSALQTQPNWCGVHWKQASLTSLYDAPLSSWEHKLTGPADPAALWETSCSAKYQAWFKVLVLTGTLRLILDFV